jgi:hypothetical protein
MRPAYDFLAQELSQAFSSMPIDASDEESKQTLVNVLRYLIVHAVDTNIEEKQYSWKQAVERLAHYGYCRLCQTNTLYAAFMLDKITKLCLEVLTQTSLFICNFIQTKMAVREYTSFYWRVLSVSSFHPEGQFTVLLLGSTGANHIGAKELA